jgi:hypothetical protein
MEAGMGRLVRAARGRVLSRAARQWLKERVEAPLLPHRLSRLAEIYGTDKWQSGFPPYYERHIAHRRRKIEKIVEIGIGGGPDPRRGGGSLKMWQRYCPNAEVIGIDLYPKTVTGPRITVLQGSQNDSRFLAEVVERVGPIDLVIDDGSHVGTDVATSFDALFPAVRSGGLYVIEDLQTSYWPQYGGGALDLAGTPIAVVKRRLDGLHHWAFKPDGYVASYADQHVAAVHVYPAIAFIEKR